jgi:hypothetical protein
MRRSRSVQALAAELAALGAIGSIGCGAGENLVAVPPEETGTIEVGTATSGANQDRNGFTVTLDSVAVLRIAVNGSVVIAGVSPGPHLIGLGDVSATCTVQGQHPVAVVVVTGATVTVAFDVSCSTPAAPPPITAAPIVVSTVTTGESQLDADGYVLVLDGTPHAAIGLNDSLVITSPSFAPRVLTLIDVAAGCRVGEPNPREVSPRPDTTRTTFAVSCGPG